MSPAPARSTAAATLEWLGCATFRVCVKGLTLFFDTFVDRVPSAEPVGVRAAEITRADFVFISHAHLDHILGADVVAKNSGAPVVGSYETIRVLRETGVPAEQRWPVSGGETIDCGRGVSVSVFPVLHSCIWAAGTADAGAPCCGELAIPCPGAPGSHGTRARLAARHDGGDQRLRRRGALARVAGRRRPAELPAALAGGLDPLLGQRRLLVGDHARPSPRRRRALDRRTGEPRRRAVPGLDGAVRRRRGRCGPGASSSATTTPGCHRCRRSTPSRSRTSLPRARPARSR